MTDSCGKAGCKSEGTREIVTLLVCEDHWAEAKNSEMAAANKLIHDIAEAGGLTWGVGFTYVFKLPNGRYKIGTSKNQLTLKRRAVDISKRYNGAVRVEAVFRGGESLERYLHHRYRDYRVMDEFGEQFEENKPLKDFLSEFRKNSQRQQVLISGTGLSVTRVGREMSDLIIHLKNNFSQ